MGAVQVAALAEAMFACETAGIDLEIAAEAFSTGSTGSPHVIRHSQSMAQRGYEGPVQFSGRGRIKDTAYGVAFMQAIGSPSILGAAAVQVFEQMSAVGFADRNDSEVIEAIRIAYSRSTAGRA
jgi:3-hydroxyisobutyrate dehydrogenase-like beta-hydroxyacid dehydrogenase